jgi:threonine aldolase
MARTIDLRSDAITRPTDRMWEAMRKDPLDWSRLGDRTVRTLEERAAALLGTDDAVFTPTGTMANTLALLSWTRHGDRFIVDRNAHVIVSEDYAFARLAGLHAETLQGERGHLSASQVAVVMASRHLGRTSRTPLIWFENTHTAAGGLTTTPEQTQAVNVVARQYHAVMHVDGARLFNAAIALNLPARSFVPEAGSVTINLNKGLSAPAGAVLCGPRAFVNEARARMLGLGGMLSNAGLIAAAGMIALEEMVERLQQDHETAAALASALAALPRLTLSPPETNIIRLDLPEGFPADHAIRVLMNDGILCLAYGDRTVRLVTHRHVEVSDIPQIKNAFDKLLKINVKQLHE